MADSKIKAVVSHNQKIDGKDYKAGENVSLEPKLARVLQGRGAIQIQDKDAGKPAPAAKKEVSK